MKVSNALSHSVNASFTSTQELLLLFRNELLHKWGKAVASRLILFRNKYLVGDNYI